MHINFYFQQFKAKKSKVLEEQMNQKKMLKLLQTSFLFQAFILFPKILSASAFEWNGTGLNNDFNKQNNWTPNTQVPGFGDTANFNNTISNINTNPQVTGTDFTVDSINLLYEAFPFTLTFNNCILSCKTITGANTNTTIRVNNLAVAHNHQINI